MPKVYPVLIVISLIIIRRSEFNRPLTVSIFFVEMDEGRPGLSSSVTKLSPCSNLLYHLYKAVFFIALFPRAVINISNVSCLDFLFVPQNLNADHCSMAAILLIRIICVTRICSTCCITNVNFKSGMLFKYYSIQKATVTELLFEH